MWLSIKTSSHNRIPCYCIGPVRVNEQLQGDLLVLVNDYVNFHIFLNCVVLTSELVDGKSTSGYWQVCTQATKYKFYKKIIYIFLYPKCSLFCPCSHPFPCLKTIWYSMCDSLPKPKPEARGCLITREIQLIIFFDSLLSLLVLWYVLSIWRGHLCPILDSRIFAPPHSEIGWTKKL